jgi:DNA-binding MarR family transcriptional regulator
MSTNWLTPPELRAWRSLVETQANLFAALDSDLAARGTSLGDYQVLVFLSETEDRSMRMCDLADALQLSPSGLTRRLDGLVQSGLVVRESSDRDRRVMLATLTADGLATLKRVAPHHVASVREHIFDHLNKTQVAALDSIFSSIAEGLKS